MANQAMINPTPEQRATRNVARIKRLRDEVIPKAKARGQAERVSSLEAELARRVDEVNALKAALAEV